MPTLRSCISDRFPRYHQSDSLVPVWQVSDANKPAIHRFFDTSPISPSGRYIAYTEFETDTRLPVPGDRAYVVAADLFSGEVVYREPTYGWDTQLGAQVQWGGDDGALLYNSVDTGLWHPYGVLANIHNSVARVLDSTIYMISNDGREALTPCLQRITESQPGYGVHVPASVRPKIEGASSEDGVTRTDLQSGKSYLWLSVREIVERIPAAFVGVDKKKGQFFVFHVKWSPDDKRVMIVLRYKDPTRPRRRPMTWLITTDRDAKRIHLALGPRAWIGGHHPNWCPDSERIIMNVVMPLNPSPFRILASAAEATLRKCGLGNQPRARRLSFVSFRYDGEEFKALSETFLGSGHPSLHESGAILSDAYAHEPVAASDGLAPLRWITDEGKRELTLVKMPIQTSFLGANCEWRVDLHPAWDRAKRCVAFNGAPQGKRAVFIADLSDLIEEERRAVLPTNCGN